MKRTLFCGLLAAAVLAVLAVPSQAVRNVPVHVNGSAITGSSYLESGVTYVPLRYLLDALGGWTISWDSRQKAAVAVSGSTKLTATPSTDTIQIDGKTLRGSVTVENGRTYVPLRMVTEALGHEVEWDPYLGGASVTTSNAAYDAEDLYWLSRIINAESGGESMKGQIAVGNVVLNRVKSKEFPNTIPGVIFDRKHAVQFEPVSNGTVYNEPTETSVQAAKLALQGVNTAGKSLYFFNPSLSQGTWIADNRAYYTTIGCHQFYL